MNQIFREFNKILKQISQKTNDSISPLKELKEWVNENLKQTKCTKQLENFDTDLHDCTILIYLLQKLCPNLDFLYLLEINDSYEKATAFIELLQLSKYQFTLPQPEEILNGNEFELIIFLARLFLFKPEQFTLIPRGISIRQLMKQRELKKIHQQRLASIKHEQKKMESTQKHSKIGLGEEIDPKTQINEEKESKLELNFMNNNRILIIKDNPNSNEKQDHEKEKEKEIKKEKEIEIELETKDIEKETKTEIETEKEKEKEKEIETEKENEKENENNKDNKMKEDKKPLLSKTDLEKISQQSIQEQYQLLQVFSDLSSQLMRNFSKHHQNILGSFVKIGKIIPELSNNFKDLKKEITNLGISNPLTYFSKVNYNSIFNKTFFKILETFGLENLDLQVESQLKDNFSKLDIKNEYEMQKFLNTTLKILKDTQIITSDLSEVGLSIISLFDQFFYSTMFKTRLVDEIIQVFRRYKLITISIRSPDFDKINNYVFNAVDQYLPGSINIEKVTNGIKKLFEITNIKELQNGKLIKQIISDSRKEAFGKSIFFIINRLFGVGFSNEIIAFFEEGSKGEKRKNQYHNKILPETRVALQEYLSSEDADNLVFSCESAICQENSKLYSANLFSFLDSIGLILPFIKVSIIHEVHKNPTPGSLFRSNDVNQKVIHRYLDNLGKEYLKKTLRPIILELLNSNLTFEIDPFHLTENQDLQRNLSNIKKYFKKFLDRIFESVPFVPPEIKIICNYYKEVTLIKYPDKVMQAIGGFIFLRLFCPGIVTPMKSGIITETVPTQTRRGLMLISSAIQCLSSGITFNKVREHMIPLNEDIVKNYPRRTEFLTKLADISDLNIDDYFIPFTSRKEYKVSGNSKKITSNQVIQHFNPDQNQAIDEKNFAIGLLIDIQKYCNWDPIHVSEPYSEIILNRMNNLSLLISDLNNIFSPIDIITKKIKELGENLKFNLEEINKTKQPKQGKGGKRAKIKKWGKKAKKNKKKKKAKKNNKKKK
ncbi:ras gtpase-activating protein [Anaeramoeba flamelloides]|uniref:Ras gtpase-activating protein n=1 Tax=Anaeramoeba flamelloides TaxID=1746091 RepID=A0ABQ8XA69_9EUKA|nr:ras gtpase-activating protein [Anaeramoeba flamelloides]